MMDQGELMAAMDTMETMQRGVTLMLPHGITLNPLVERPLDHTFSVFGWTASCKSGESRTGRRFYRVFDRVSDSRRGVSGSHVLTGFLHFKYRNRLREFNRGQ